MNLTFSSYWPWRSAIVPLEAHHDATQRKQIPYSRQMTAVHLAYAITLQ